MLFQRVRAILKDEYLLPDESKFLIGVSGGPDSICLLDILSKLPYEIIIGHLDHCLRPSSFEEMQFVKKLALKYRCKFIGKSENILEQSLLNKIGIEETARKERYRFLFNSAQEEKAAAVLVAHQADDQIETLLMNLIRGSGLEGLAGMQVMSLSEFDLKIPLIRPLLNTWREEILKYCQDHKLEFRLDESNFENANTRSSIRNHLIPELSKYNPRIKESILRTQKIIEEDLNFLKESTSEAEDKIQLTWENDEITLDLEAFNILPINMQRLVIKDILFKYFFQQECISFSNIEYIRKMFVREIKKTSLKISNQLFIFISGNKGIAAKNKEPKLDNLLPKINQELNIRLLPSNITINETWQLEIEEILRDQIGEEFIKNQDSYRAYFDKEKINETITIRPWAKGDRFQPLGMGGNSIKLSDYWINRKVSRQARLNWPLVSCKNQIIWIPGFQQAHNTRITGETRNITIMRLKRK
jgi:tRNA(Ile)-lysidine synthase